MNLFEMKRQHAHASTKAGNILALMEASGRKEFTTAEQADMDLCTVTMNALEPQIRALQAKNTLSAQIGSGGPLMTGSAKPTGGLLGNQVPARPLSHEYVAAWQEYIVSKGTKVDSALYEGSDGAGGYAVPVVVNDQIVPLAPQELAVRQLVQVVPTVADIRFPVQASFATAALKIESGATVYSFSESDPSLSQFTLSAFMIGVLNNLSWELVQDVPTFQSFAVRDMILAQQMFEENLYVNGSGSGQAQGLIGNTGTGVTVDPDANGNVVGLNGILDLIGTLNAVYHPNASFLMARTTSIGIRKAQIEANLFNPAWTRVGIQDYLYGYPVYYSAYMPTAARGNTPVLFGDFKSGYVIGDRGGSGINVKILDQPLASQGQLQLLTYRRTDGRIRRSEAIQAYTSTASGTSSPE